MLAKLTSKGQLTLPKRIRDELRLEAGTQIDFTIQPDGTFSARPLKRSASSIIGLLYEPGRPATSVAQMDEAIGQYLSDKHDRILRTGTSEVPAAATAPRRRRR